MTKATHPSRPYYIGLPQWHHPQWYAPDHKDAHSLSVYARHFSSVEGNHSFYGLPSAHSVKQWQAQTPEGFEFCLKFPRTISHSGNLLACDHLVEEFIQRIAPLEQRIGIIWLQLSQQFAPQHLEALNVFLDALPKHYCYAVEVRNLRLFDKATNEKKLNQILIQHQVNRVIFDTRSLFANPFDDPETLDAIRKKPRVPTHVIATADKPLVRFISPLNLSLSKDYLRPWVKKTLQWIDEEKTPYLFFHTPGNENAPQLAQWFSQEVNKIRPEIDTVKLWDSEPKQQSLL
ncbi:MAG: DUF72 domain-containing protein [Leucothrix sp.]